MCLNWDHVGFTHNPCIAQSVWIHTGKGRDIVTSRLYADQQKGSAALRWTWTGSESAIDPLIRSGHRINSWKHQTQWPNAHLRLRNLLQVESSFHASALPDFCIDILAHVLSFEVCSPLCHCFPKDPLLGLERCSDLSIPKSDALYRDNIVTTESWMFVGFKGVSHRQCLGDALCLEDVDWSS